MCVHTNVLHNAETVTGQKMFKIYWDSSEWRVPRKFFPCAIFDTRAIGSSLLPWTVQPLGSVTRSYGHVNKLG